MATVTGPLTDFVPSAGLRWLVVAHPAELAHDPAFHEALELLLPTPRLAAFAVSSGLDLREVTTGLAAGFDYATLYAAECPTGGELVERRFVDRLAGAEHTERSEQPTIVRISGTRADVPETLVDVRGRFVAVSVGDPTPARVLELYARRRLTRSPSALRGAALAALPSSLAAAPIVLYAPGPFSGEWAAGARGLLGGATAMAATVVPKGEAIELTVVLAGAFDAVDADRLVSAWTDLEASSMGKLLSLDQPIAPPKAALEDGRLVLRIGLSLRPLATGLRAAVAADVWEILNIPPPPSGPARPAAGSRAAPGGGAR
ncbi:MAG TPA: hypothetical protein VHE30_10875 [Polyangiaceae bacterium]|nr:hypothetical protein [Polyangiaceae bacterium]